MQFNRNEYLKFNYDTSITAENEANYYANVYKGLEWNQYIKSYLKRCFGNYMATSGYTYNDIMNLQLANSMIDYGLFTQAAEYFEQISKRNPALATGLEFWAQKLREADDYEYQKDNNPEYQTFIEREQAKAAAIPNL